MYFHSNTQHRPAAKCRACRSASQQGSPPDWPNLASAPFSEAVGPTPPLRAVSWLVQDLTEKTVNERFRSLRTPQAIDPSLETAIGDRESPSHATSRKLEFARIAARDPAEKVAERIACARANAIDRVGLLRAKGRPLRDVQGPVASSRTSSKIPPPR